MSNFTQILASVFFISIAYTAYPQTIDKPNFALASHPITVVKIERTTKYFILNLSLENKMEHGYFCASKTIYLEDIKSGNRLKLDHAKGIPVCPDVYHFRWKGEKLPFSLYFPLPDSGFRYVNVIESCEDHCLSIYGLITDTQMNENINKGFDAYVHHNLDFALKIFQATVKQNADYPFGYLYTHIIKILLEQKNYQEAKIWYKKVLESNFPDKNSILKQIDKFNNANRLE